MRLVALLLCVHATATLRVGHVGRLRYCATTPVVNRPTWASSTPRNESAYVFEVDGRTMAMLFVNKSETSTVATRMVYDASTTIEYFPSFRSIVHKYANDIDLTMLPDDERMQFLTL